jgi:4,5-dihydroxyphthalate decarboxylase
MKKMPFKLVTKDYDYYSPITYGDVVAEGLDLDYERDTANVLDRTLTDASIQAGEIPFGRYISAIAQGNAPFVGLPVFPNRAFRHRCIFVRRGSGITRVEELAGKRMGCNEWPATGHVWTRAILPHHGVPIESVKWFVGSIDGAVLQRSQGKIPDYAQAVTDRNLLTMLEAGELDGLIAAHPPKAFYKKDGPLVRLLADYRGAEMEYYLKTKIYPTIHIVGVRNEVAKKDPWVVRSVFNVMDQARRKWQEERKKMPDATPWLIQELEDSIALFGEENWAPYGVEPNRATVQALCDELFRQGFVARKVDAAEVFAGFEAALKAG